jgi:hypothetical protein
MVSRTPFHRYLMDLPVPAPVNWQALCAACPIGLALMSVIGQHPLSTRSSGVRSARNLKPLTRSPQILSRSILASRRTKFGRSFQSNSVPSSNFL